MNIINISQTVVSNFRRQGKEANIERRRSSERRIHADRRKEKRFGDVNSRRQQAERRSD